MTPKCCKSQPRCGHDGHAARGKKFAPTAVRGGTPSGQEEIQMAAKAEQAGKPETWMLGAGWGKQGGGKGVMGVSNQMQGGRSLMKA